MTEAKTEAALSGWLDGLAKDFQLAIRAMSKSPLFAAVTTLSLALGIGANTMVFTVMKRVVMDSLPVPNADRLVVLHAIGARQGHSSTDGMQSSFSYPQYRDLANGARSLFTGLLARFGTQVTLDRRQASERITCELVSGNYFSLLGVRPWRGRVLTPSDNQTAGEHPVAVLGYGEWQGTFGGDPSIIGSTIRLNTHPYVVVGIAPPEFHGIEFDSPPDVYVPIVMRAQITPEWDGLENRLEQWATLIGSLKPGVTLLQAQSALSVLYPPIRDLDLSAIKSPSAGFRASFSHTHIELTPGGKGYADIRSTLEKPLQFLAVMVAIVLLITIVNVANLLIARGAARERDMAVRLSIGAGKWLLVRQVLAESVVLAAFGGGLGVLFAYTATPVLLKLLSTQLSESSIDARPDAAVLLAMASVTLLAAFAFGLLPAFQSARTDPALALKSEGSTGYAGGHLWLRRVLVGGQIGLSMLLLTGALLFTKSLSNMRHLNVGFRTEKIVAFKVDPSGAGYSQARIHVFIENLLRNLRSLPGVANAASATSPVLENDQVGRNITVEGSHRVGGDDSQVLTNLVSDGYFETFGIPLLSGRTLKASDANTKFAVVNATFVKHFLPGENPIGRHFEFGAGHITLEGTIAGVVADSQHESLRSKIQPFIWVPYRTAKDLRTLTFYVHTNTGKGDAMTDQIRKVVHGSDPALPLYEFRTIDKVIAGDLFAERGLAAVSNIFAGLSIVLASIGLYGVVSYSVTRRRREFGIRMAVGATPGDVLLSVLRETALVGIVSLACALPVVLGTGELLRSSLYGVQPNDPVICAFSALSLFIVAVLAGFVPAREAARIDPQVALRSS